MLKKNLLLALGFLALASSCTSESGVEELPSDKHLPQIFADKSIVNIEENEKVSFTVEYLDINVTDGAKIINLTTGDTLLGNEIALDQEMNYEFQAFFKGKLSPNKAVVRGARPTLSDIFYRQHVLYDFTGTWCGACPGMIQAIKLATRDYPDRLLPVEAHIRDELSNDASEYLEKKFAVEAFPSLIIDGSHDYYYKGNGTSAKAIISSSKRSLQENPTAGGLKMDTHLDANNQITVELEASVLEANEYKVCVALLVDGFAYDQTGNMYGNSAQNHVLWAYLQGESSGDALGMLQKDQKVAKTYTYDFSDLPNLPIGITQEDCHIMAYILNKQADGSYQINNATSCTLGTNVDYRYEYILDKN